MTRPHRRKTIKGEGPTATDYCTRPAHGIPHETGEFHASGRFTEVHVADFEWEQAYSTAQYLDLLATYSNHIVLPGRAGLFDCLETLAGELDDRIVKRYLTRLTWSHSR